VESAHSDVMDDDGQPAQRWAGFSCPGHGTFARLQPRGDFIGLLRQPAISLALFGCNRARLII